MNAPTCGAVRERLSAYLEGELEAREARDLRSHLEGCPGCRAELDLMRLTVGALRRLPVLPPPARIIEGVRVHLRPDPWHRRLFGGRQWLLGVPVGALATLLVVLGVALFQARFPGIEQGRVPPLPEKREAAPPAPLPAAPAIPAAPAKPEDPAKPKGLSPPPEAGRAVQRAEERSNKPVVKAREPAGISTSADSEARRVPTPAASPVTESVTFASPPPAERSVPQAAPAPPGFAIPETELPPSGVSVVKRTDGERGMIQGPASRPPAAPGAPRRGSWEVVPPESRGSHAPAAAASGTANRIVPRAALPAPGQRPVLGSGQAAFAPVGAARESSRSAIPGVVELGPPRVTSPPASEVPPPGVEARRREIAEPHLTVVCLLQPGGGTVGEFSVFLKREGTREVRIRALAPREVRDAFAPHRELLALLPGPTRGWSVTARVPSRKLAGLLAALADRPGLRLLETPSLQPSGGNLDEPREVRLTVLR